MSNPFLSFTIKALFALAIAFGIHLAALHFFKLPLFENRIVLSYAVNLVLIVVIFGVLYLLKNKYKGQLGFLFLAGSVLKFAVFFVLFYPFYKLDGVITKLEFAAFFIPYAIGLVLESVSLSKWLNKLD
ncbi:hypothetical protein WJN01_03310 [Flavobacteriaceae bacterium SZ-1-7]|uniref:DUF6168 family protein n=1 Tax=Tamlana sedimenti TaxID=3134126 RepID=UPI003126E4BC